MPGENSVNLNEIRSAIVQKGDDRKREVQGNKEGREPPRMKLGPKLVIRDADRLEDSIEADYNPSVWPFNKQIEYNDKDIIGGDDSLEFKSIKKQEFSFELFFTDFGSHTPKTNFKDTTSWKLAWLESRTNPKPHFDQQANEFIDAPPVMLIERGIETDTVVITKVEYKVDLFNKGWTPQRAKVRLTVRRVLDRRKKRGGRNGRNF